MCAWFLAGFLILFLTGQETVYADGTPINVDNISYQVGKIDQIKSNRVIIDDVSYNYTDRTMFLNSAGKPTEQRYFSKGELVKFAADANRNLLVLRKP